MADIEAPRRGCVILSFLKSKLTQRHRLAKMPKLFSLRLIIGIRIIDLFPCVLRLFIVEAFLPSLCRKRRFSNGFST